MHMHHKLWFGSATLEEHKVNAILRVQIMVSGARTNIDRQRYTRTSGPRNTGKSRTPIASWVDFAVCGWPPPKRKHIHMWMDGKPHEATHLQQRMPHGIPCLTSLNSSAHRNSKFGSAPLCRPLLKRQGWVKVRHVTTLIYSNPDQPFCR